MKPFSDRKLRVARSIACWILNTARFSCWHRSRARASRRTSILAGVRPVTSRGSGCCATPSMRISFGITSTFRGVISVRLTVPRTPMLYCLWMASAFSATCLFTVLRGTVTCTVPSRSCRIRKRMPPRSRMS